MHTYGVGQPYITDKVRWPEHCEYNFRGGGHELLMFLRYLKAADITAIRYGPADFGLYVDGDLLIFLFRFGAAVPWSDAPYNWHLMPEHERVPPPDEESSEPALLQCILVDADTGIIRALRLMSLGAPFSAELHAAISAQMSRPFDAAGYDRRLEALYARYDTAALLTRAQTRCTAGA